MTSTEVLTAARSPEESATTKLQDDQDGLYQDVVSQFPLLNGYTHMVLGFQPDPQVTRDDIIAGLKEAFAQVTSAVPWLNGHLAHEVGPAGSSGRHAAAPWPLGIPRKEQVRAKDCDDLMPRMDDILLAGAPISMLDGSALTPWPGLPVPHGIEGPLPVITLQANFVRGGMILNVAMHHMLIDGSSYVQLMRLLATALKGLAFPPADVEQATRDRRRVVPLIPSGEPVKDHAFLRAPLDYKPSPPSSPAKWCYYKLPVSAFATLRRLATPQNGKAPQVSDNDLLCAFCWQRLSAVRITRGVAPHTLTKFTRIIDARGAVGVPLTYLGHLVYYAFAQLTMGHVANASLGALAQILRRELNAANTPWAVRSYATFLARERDRTRLIYAGVRDLDTDIGATSFTASQGDDGRGGESALPDDFGPLLGRLRFLRRPLVSPLPGGITINPVEDGTVPICLCMPAADLEGLEKDPEWQQHVQYLG